MGKALIQSLITALMACILPFSQAAEHGVIVLYHHVAEDTPPSTTITPAAFQSHLEFLRDNNFNVMALDDMVEALRNRQQIPEKSVAITFDDGYVSIYQEAFPMLQRFGFPFAVFLSTQPINDGQAGYMNWAQISEMSKAGVVIANHMVDHPYMLTKLKGESQSEWIARLRAEMLLAEQNIEANTGQQHKYLAYPYGEFDPDIKAMLASEGFTGLAQNSGAVGFTSDFLALPRYPLASIYANLNTASTKFASLAFNVVGQTPDNPVTASTSPPVQIHFGPGDYSLDQVNCFANNRPLSMTWLDKDIGLLALTPEREFTDRRWRYICTAPLAGTGRFFWYSVQWIRPR